MRPVHQWQGPGGESWGHGRLSWAVIGTVHPEVCVLGSCGRFITAITLFLPLGRGQWVCGHLCLRCGSRRKSSTTLQSSGVWYQSTQCHGHAPRVETPALTSYCHTCLQSIPSLQAHPLQTAGCLGNTSSTATHPGEGCGTQLSLSPPPQPGPCPGPDSEVALPIGQVLASRSCLCQAAVGCKDVMGIQQQR